MSFEGQGSEISSIAYSQDGKRLAAAAGNYLPSGTKNTVKIWDLDSGKPFTALEENYNTFFSSVSFSHDGKRFATGSLNHKAIIWNLTPEPWQQVDNASRRIDDLTFQQLSNYDLYNILNIHPQNEQILINTRNSKQIAAFADLYSNKILQTGFPKKEDYQRALRLYQACLTDGLDNDYFEKKISDLKKAWRAKNN